MPSSQPTAAPTTRPTAILYATSKASQRHAHCPRSVPSVASSTAAVTKGNARASLRPASLVRPKRTSSSACSRSSPSTGSVAGSPTCTSPARTGSVGASAAPSSSAPAGARPSSRSPSRKPAAMVSGIATPSRRQVDCQRSQPGGLSRPRPAPIREMMTVTSARCSTTTGCWPGRASNGTPGSSPPMPPRPRNTIGSDSGRPSSSRGRTAASRAPTPTTRKAMSGRRRSTSPASPLGGPSNGRSPRLRAHRRGPCRSPRTLGTPGRGVPGRGPYGGCQDARARRPARRTRR